MLDVVDDPLVAGDKPAEKPKDVADRLASRATGFEYEIPAYKYAAIFKPYEELLEKKTP